MGENTSCGSCEGSGWVGWGQTFLYENQRAEPVVEGNRFWVNKKRVVSQFTVHPKGCGVVLSCH